MALAVTLRFDFLDDKGKESFTKIRVPNGFAIADYIEFGQAAAQLLTNISQAQITRASVCFNVDLSGLSLDTIASSIASVAKKVALRFRTAVTGFFAKTLIPGVQETQVVVGSDDLNQVDAGVMAVVSMFEDGVAVTGGTMTFTNDREHDITTLSSAKESFRKRRAA